MDLFNAFTPSFSLKYDFFSRAPYEGCYSVLLDIFNLAKKEIIIIDNYIGKELLDELRIINRKILVISSNITDTLKNKYLKQYNNVSFAKNDSYHDRFIIIDRKRIFRCGASFKDLGKKCFGIHELENKIEIEKIINDITNNCSIDN